MASFRKRSNGWQVRIKRKGYPEQTKTFTTYNEATAWARLIESEIDRGTFVNRSEAENTTLRELLNRYFTEVTPHKKGATVEGYRIQTWLKTSLADRYLSSIRSADFAHWRDKRIKEGKSPNTIRLELAVISNMLNIARTEWGFESLINTTENVRIPRLPNGRTRRVSDAEIALLIENTESYELPYILRIALETGMRRGEIASLVWRNIDLNTRTLLLTTTKNGERRQVPLSSNCINVIKKIPKRTDGHVFGMTPHAISYAFIRACKRCGLNDLHFHDIRHESITRLFERGLNVVEVSSISGHKTLQMLKRYTHLRAEDLAKKLA